MAAVLNVVIYSDLSEFPTEKRYDPNIKVSELKKKLELITGANHSSMKIKASIENEQLGELDNNDKTLADYVGAKLNHELPTVKLVVEDDQAKELLSGDVPKYNISEEKYQEREDSARKFIRETRERQEKVNK